ncbi:MAG: hypothetical protein ACYCSI_08250 [Solirubrobacteraceae bacterium]
MADAEWTQDEIEEHAKPILLAIGAVVVGAAALEKLLLADIAHRAVNERGASRELADELSGLENVMAGRLMRRLRELGLPPALAERINDVIERRNRLVHRAMEDPDFARAVSTGAGVEAVVGSITGLASDCQDVCAELRTVDFPGLEGVLGASLPELARTAEAADPAEVEDESERAALERVQAMLTVVDQDALASYRSAFESQVRREPKPSDPDATELRRPQAPLFERYADAIRELPGGRLSIEELRGPRFRLQTEGPIEVFYTPFDHVNEHARVTLIGITPGWQQMRSAYEAARDLLTQNVPNERVLAGTSDAAGFSGPMRANLLAMIDRIGVADCLEIDSSAALFAERADLRHGTSAIRYAAFVGGQNYTGSRPPLLRVPLFRSYVLDVLADELEQVPDSIVIPLGRSVESAITLLIDGGKLDRARCCLGFPHPSGGNGHRVRQFAEARERLRAEVRRWFSASAA